MDPLSAFGLASGILAFMQFGYKTCRAGREIYKSDSGALLDQQERKDMTFDLQTLMGDLKASDLDAPPSSKHEMTIRKVAASCSDQAERLMEVVRGLDADPNRKRWHSIKKGFMTIWKEKEIAQMEQRLDSLRSQLIFGMSALLCDQQSSMMKTLKGIENHHKELQIQGPNEVRFLCKQLQTSLADASQNSGQGHDLAPVVADIARLTEESQKQTKVQHILESLRYKSMHERNAAIKEAYGKTFNWIFDDFQASSGKPVPFKKWLCAGQGVFWIRGKPGSGKSTLMKHLTYDASLEPLLRVWAGQSPVVTAKFFFWYSGNQMQKSQQGLLQSLLYEVLRQCPDAIDDVVPTRWLDSSKDYEPDPWTRSEILKSIKSVAEHHVGDLKFCFFIDGLDEYEGDHSELVDVIESFASLQNVKFCVASRPWNVFEKAFRPNSDGSESLEDNTLLLQDYTVEDMRHYVRQNLEFDPDFLRFNEQDPRYKHLLDDLVNRARGVFLWVYLAVTSLKKGFTNRDTLVHLQKRLDDFPPSLEEYFQRMLDSVDPVYRPRTSQMLLVAICAKEPLHLWIYGYLDSGDFDSAIRAPIQRISDEKLLDQLVDIRRRVNAQCQDLLETVARDDTTCYQLVEFIHRTVKDFLTTRVIQDQLKSRLQEPFDPRSFICRALLAQLKTLTLDQSMGEYRDESNFDVDIIEYAQDLEADDKYTEHEVLDEAERVAHASFIIQQGSSIHQRDRIPLVVRAMKFHMPCYVKHRISKEPTLINSIGKSEAPALWWLLFDPETKFPDAPLGMFSTIYEADVSMIKLLLDSGADPNQRYGGASVWAALLHQMFAHEHKLKDHSKQMWFEVIEAMLVAGANPGLRLSLEPKTLGTRDTNYFWKSDAYYPVPEIISYVFSPEQALELETLMRPKWTSRIIGYFGYK